MAAQSWTRAIDADNGTKLNSGARVAIEEGTVNAGKVWYLATAGSINVGTTALLFADEHPVASQAQIEAGTDDKTIVTPKKLRFGFAHSTRSERLYCFPILDGRISDPVGKRCYPSISQSVTMTYPIPFPTRTLNGGAFTTTILFRRLALTQT